MLLINARGAGFPQSTTANILGCTWRLLSSRHSLSNTDWEVAILCVSMCYESAYSNHVTSEWTLSYATPQCIKMLLTFYIIQVT